ncbi:MAG TPA: hypothetical protein VL945_02705 [Candidatus Saccharimonadales bacterium]|nr:hypothetical protein [Candidatus Saccharimonadales bacterium]
MDPECRNISRLILPAVRASIAEIMKHDYNYRQDEIARSLGVVQVSVSKYLNRRYSSEIARMRQGIMEKGLSRGIAEDIANGKTAREIGMEIDRLCGQLAAGKS